MHLVGILFPHSVCKFMKGVFVSVCPSRHPLGNSTSSAFITELLGLNSNVLMLFRELPQLRLS